MRLVPLPYRANRVAMLLLALLGLAIGIEYLQLHTGRQFSLRDIYLDACGIAVGARLSLPIAASLPRWLRHVGDAVLIILIAAGLRDAGLAVFNKIYVSQQFPLLWSPHQVLAESRLAGSSSRKIVTEETTGQPVLQVTFGTQRYSSFELMPLVSDWRNHSNLNITAMNPSPMPLEITCRVHDSSHYKNGAKLNDRFNQRVTLNTGWNTASFSLHDIESAPRKREMDMSRIENLTCFTVQLTAPRQAFFKEIWLSQ